MFLLATGVAGGDSRAQAAHSARGRATAAAPRKAAGEANKPSLQKRLQTLQDGHEHCGRLS